MQMSARFAIAVAAAAAFLVTTLDSADAHRRHKSRAWRTIEQCQGPIEGLASSTGILGLGTAKARDAARYDWETKAANAYGPSYGNLSLARDVRWDCKKNAILLAKCVVIAKPCEGRISG